MSHAGPADGSTTGRPLVVVASDQALIADSVRAALDASGLAAAGVRWPRLVEPGIGAAGGARGPGSGARADVGVMLCDFERETRLVAARLLLSEVPVAWVVLTGVQEGPLWGAVLERGARFVLPSSTSLAHLIEVVGEVRRGARIEAATSARLVASWQAAQDERDTLVRQLERLSPRESAVLRLLYRGGRVRSIAALLEVSEATVRSQVRSVLRKLGVNSQLAAVAAYAAVHGEDGDRGPVLPNIEETSTPGPGERPAYDESLSHAARSRRRTR